MSVPEVPKSDLAHRTEEELLGVNLSFYDPLWKKSRLASPKQFNTWPLVHSLLTPSQSRLEVAPGLRPRLPVDGTWFVDASGPAVAKLRLHGASAEIARVSSLPFADGTFDLVAAFDIVEHVEDDDAALSELVRVAAPKATLLISVPLHASRWTKFDDLVGHRRRYEPEAILSKLARHGLSVERSAVYGMQPRSPWLLAFGIWWLTYLRQFAIWWYDRIILRFGAVLQNKLELSPGLLDLSDVDEVLLVCRKFE
jgi:SAM-dependent methyltransferase